MTRSLLAHRLPNPPPLFVGRQAQIRRLAALVQRSSMAIVHGEAGAGKTALVLHTLHKRFTDRVDSAVYVEASRHEPLVATVARALAGAHGLDRVTAVEDEELLALVIDVAEQSARWIVIEDGDLAWPSETWRLAATAASYAREARWILTVRHPPDPTLIDRAVLVPPLADQELRQLADEWLADELSGDARALLVDEARGSPWRLRELAASRRQSGSEGFVHGLSASAIAALEVLVWCHAPVPSDVLDAIRPGCSRALPELARRALAVARDDGVRLHDAARTVIAGAVSVDPGLAEKLASKLGARDEPSLVFEAVRLHLSHGDHRAAARLLDRAGAGLIAAGFVRALGQLMPGAAEPVLARWRLRVAVELGDAAAIAACPRPEEPRDQLTWAEGLARRGLTGPAIDEALRLARILDAEGARHANQLAARCLSNRGRVDDALAVLDDPGSARAPDDPVRDAMAARTLALAGRPEHARQLVAKLERRLQVRTDPSDGEVLLLIAGSHHDLGQLDRAQQTLDELDSRESDELARFFDRKRSLVRAAVLLDRGKLDAAGTLLSELQRRTGTESLHRWFIDLLDTQLALARGEIAPAALRLATFFGERAGEQSGYLMAWAELLALRCHLIDPWAHPRPPRAGGQTYLETHTQLARTRAALRRAETIEDRAEPAAGNAHPEAVLAEHAVDWERAIIEGDGRGAMVIAASAIASAKASGFGVWEAEARAGRCEGAIVAGERRELAREADALSALADDLGSPGYRAAARWFGLLAQDPCPEAMEPLARSAHAPAIARRARHLLGARVSIDRLDQRVLSATGWPSVRQLAGPDAGAGWTAGWGIDLARRCLWLPDARRIDLDDRPSLWRIIAALAERGGQASKEQLVAAVWGAADYHPLHHDKRLQNAVHKLRQLIEDDPSAPERVVTTSDGYRLGDRQPVRCVDPPAASAPRANR